MNGIEILNVSKEYSLAGGSTICALEGINLTIRPGEFIGIVGMNGSGKTTLARLLNGLILPSDGAIRINGLNPANQDDIREIRRLVGMVFQNPDNQIINPSVEEEVAFGPGNLGLSSGEVCRRTDWALNVTGLSELRYHAPHLLSGGQKQRLAVAAALAMLPFCLVLDEPTSMLDQVGRRGLIQCLRELNQEYQIIVIMISHCMEDIAGADRLIVMHRGSVYLDGPPGEVFCSPEFALAGLKPPPIARLTRSLAQKGHQIDEKIVTYEQMVRFLCR